MNMKEKNAKKSKIHQLGFSFLKRESNYLDRQRQAILVCFSVMLSFGHPVKYPGLVWSL